MYLNRVEPSFYYKIPLYRIIVDTDKHLLTLLHNEDVYKQYKIAVGKETTPTPIGIFSIVRKAKNPGGPFGSRWIQLSLPHYGIHGTNDDSSIGKDVSHGCIRLHNKDVNELYNIVPIGTKVEIV